MTGITSLALMGLFAWSGMNTGGLTAAPAAYAATSATLPQQTIAVRLTAYNAVADQTDKDPNTTASGSPSNPEVIAARSQDLADELPFGTVITLEAPEKSANCGFALVEHLVGYRVIADTMQERMHNRVDIMFDMDDAVRVHGKLMNPARAMGVCEVSIRVVGKIALKDIPTTQSALALLVDPELASR